MHEPLQGKRRRVPALAPDERRAAIIEATIPLLRVHGAAVTTKQIAEAAGVAEGTLFGVFADKASLVLAALGTAFDAGLVLQQLQAIDRSAPLRQRLREAAALLLPRFQANVQLMMVARTLPVVNGQHHFEALMAGRRQLVDVVATIVEPDRALLRRSPAATASFLVMLLVATAQPDLAQGLDEPNALDADDVVAVLLDGLLIRRPDAHAGDA